MITSYRTGLHDPLLVGLSPTGQLPFQEQATYIFIKVPEPRLDKYSQNKLTYGMIFPLLYSGVFVSVLIFRPGPLGGSVG